MVEFSSVPAAQYLKSGKSFSILKLILSKNKLSRIWNRTLISITCLSWWPLASWIMSNKFLATVSIFWTTVTSFNLKKIKIKFLPVHFSSLSSLSTLITEGPKTKRPSITLKSTPLLQIIARKMSFRKISTKISNSNSSKRPNCQLKNTGWFSLKEPSRNPWRKFQK